MYRPVAFAIDDIAVLHSFVHQYNFATIAAEIEGAITLAYAPVLLDASGECGRIRFHLAARNPFAALKDGERLCFSFVGPQAYVSSDWYKTLTTVPTWNYMAVEARGTIRRVRDGELRQLLVELSAAEEERLRPKSPWTMDKVESARLQAMMDVIVGFEVALESIVGKFKLSQDKKPEDVSGVIDALESRGDTASLSVARAMRNYSIPKA